MSKVIYFEAARPGIVHSSLWYFLRRILHGGNTTATEGRKRIIPGQPYGHWAQGFQTPAMPYHRRHTHVA